MLRAFLSNRITWALAGVVALAALLPVGLRNSDAAFVAGTTNNGSLFSRDLPGDLQHRRRRSPIRARRCAAA